MAQWQRTLDLTPEWDKANDHEITVQALSVVVGSRLKALSPFEDADIEEQRQELVYEFEAMGRDGCNQDEFNGFLSDLYDWADTSLDGKFGGKKVCWVKK